MIIFEGQITGKCCIEFFKQCQTQEFIYPILGIISVGIIAALAWAITGPLVEYLIFIPLYGLFFIPVLIPYKPGGKLSPKHWKKITIDIDEGTMYFNEGKTEEEFLILDDITKIYDMGEFYHVCDAGNVYLQKSLLVEGTIEEFEQLFDGKIIKKY
jgi:hypothetical protein